jgi:hypothetical protein
METLVILKNAELELRNRRQENWSRITGVEASKISVINDEFISINASEISDLKKVMTTLTPFKNGHKIEHKTPVYLTSEYVIRLKNNYYDRILNFEFELINGLKFWLNIPVMILPREFKDMFLTRTTRGLYDTETVYVNMESHLKEFKEIRIESYSFNSQNLNWYGGDQTLICEHEIKSMVNFIKN